MDAFNSTNDFPSIDFTNFGKSDFEKAFMEGCYIEVNETYKTLCSDLVFEGDDDIGSGFYNVLQDARFTTAAIVCYVVVIMIGTLGNLLVVLTLCSRKHNRTATEVFIISLAVADILVCLIDLPVSLQYQVNDDWLFGATFCHILPTVLAIVAYVSSLMLTLIAIDRYILIVHPLRRRMTVREAALCVLGAFIIAVAGTTPIAVFSAYIEVPVPFLGITNRYCIEQWPTQTQRQVYAIITLLLQFVVPLCIVTVLYVLVFRKLQTRFATGNKSSKGRRTTKMLLSVVIVFFLAWTPYHLFSILSETSYEAIKGKYYKFIDVMLRVLAMSSSCINPFLYGWFNETYRTAFLALIGRAVSGGCTSAPPSGGTTIDKTYGSTRGGHTQPQHSQQPPSPPHKDSNDSSCAEEQAGQASTADARHSECAPLKGCKVDYPSRGSMTSYSSTTSTTTLLH